MMIIRLLAISLLASLLACGIVSLIVLRRIDAFSFVPIVTLFPIACLLQSGGLVLDGRGMPRVSADAILCVAGAVLGVIATGLVSGTWDRSMLLGMMYGLATALSLRGLNRVGQRSIGNRS